MISFAKIFKLCLIKLFMVDEKVSTMEQLLDEAEGIKFLVTPCTILSDCIREFQEKADAAEYPFPAGHAMQVEQDRAWSILGHQVVGAEVFLERRY